MFLVNTLSLCQNLITQQDTQSVVTINYVRVSPNHDMDTIWEVQVVGYFKVYSENFPGEKQEALLNCRSGIDLGICGVRSSNKAVSNIFCVYWIIIRVKNIL